MDGSFDKGESPDQPDLALSVSTVGHSDGRQAMNGNGGDDSFQLATAYPLADDLSAISIQLKRTRADRTE